MGAVEKYTPRADVVPAVPTTDELSHLMEVVRSIGNTDFVPRDLRGNNPAILACVLFGREAGLGPMESLSEVHMIDGRPSLSAKAKLKRAREAGHSITTLEETPERVVLHGRRGDNGDEMTVAYTLAEAQEAGLTGKPNWKKHQPDMLFARAATRLCKRLFGDMPGAIMLDPDEAELTPEERIDEVLGDVKPPADGEQPDDASDAEATEVVDEQPAPVDDAPADTGGDGAVPEGKATPPAAEEEQQTFAQMAERAQARGRKGAES